MTDIKFEILKLFYNAPYNEVAYTQIFNALCLEPQIATQAQVRNALIDFQNLEKPLIRKCIGKNSYKLTSDGRSAYENENELRDKISHNDADADNPAIENTLPKHSKFLSYLEKHLPLFARLIIKLLDLIDNS